MRIIIDPGHGGKDPGAVGNGLREADVNIKLAQYLEAELKGKHQVVLTRRGNLFVSLPERTAFSNAVNADLFISLHCNSAANSQANGIETLCYSEKSRGFNYAHKVQQALVKGTGLTDRGVKIRSDLYVLRHTVAPAILIELGFISNPKDAAWLKNQENIKKAARLIAQAIN